MNMKWPVIVAVCTFVTAFGASAALADCQISDAKLEEAVLQNPNLRGLVNRQAVRDLRSLRDAAMTLRSYGRHEDCERLLGNIRELIAGPPMGSLGDNDEEAAEKQMDAQERRFNAAQVEVAEIKKGRSHSSPSTNLLPV
jgi:hypothetical protein